MSSEVYKYFGYQWVDDIDKEELEKLSAVGYSPEQIALYFDVNTMDFLHVFYMEDSIIKHHYDRGILMAQAQDGMKCFEGVKSGNVTQAQRLDKIRYSINFENQKKRIVYGE